MKKNLFSMFVLALVLFVSVVASRTVLASDTIKIGILGPFTGSLAFNAGEMKKGMLLALDEVNTKGGLFGKKIEIVFGDTECKPDKGLAAVKKLVTRDNVLVVGGGYCSSVNIAASEFCQFEECPVVVGIAISPTITNRGYNFVFRSCPSSALCLDGINQWLKQVRKPKTVAFFMENSDYGRDAQAILEVQCKKIGAKVLGTMYFEIGGTDFTPAISKLKNLNPDLVFSVGSTTEAALIQKQAKELDYVTQWIGLGGQFTQAYFEMTGPISQYAMGSSSEPTKAMKNPVTAAFVKSYEKKFPGSRPGVFSGQGYDNMKVILEAIKQASKPTDNLAKDRLKIRDALTKTDMDLTQGKIKFKKDGQVYNLVAQVIQVQLDGNCKPDTEVIFPPALANSEYQAPTPWSQRKCK